MSGLEKALFNLKVHISSATPPHPSSCPMRPLTNTPLLAQFTAKQLNRQSAKAGKDENAEKAKLKKAIQQNHGDIAKIYAQNAIR